MQDPYPCPTLQANDASSQSALKGAEPNQSNPPCGVPPDSYAEADPVRTSMRPARTRSRRFLPVLIAAIVGLSAATLSAAPARADHNVVTSTFYGVTPPWQGGAQWNGYKVFLSAPRHANSGSRGECGWEENINGREWNWEAAFWSNGSARNIAYRGFAVVVSGNPRDDNYLANRTEGNNYGAQVYIVTHSNASTGRCNSSQYLLVMHRSGNNNSIGLKNSLLHWLDPVVPGGQNNWNCDTLAECSNSNLAPHRAYVELFFHTNQNAVNWFQCCDVHGVSVPEGWRYGAAIDNHLGYP